MSFGDRYNDDRDEPSGLSLNIQDDAFGITMLMDDQMVRIDLYERVIFDIRKALGDDGIHCQLHDLADVVRRRCASEGKAEKP
jgi:hypothetical protein